VHPAHRCRSLFTSFADNAALTVAGKCSQQSIFDVSPSSHKYERGREDMEQQPLAVILNLPVSISTSATASL
jgi:hypothetical protein